MQPDYVAQETKVREEFLSQLGNFSPGERDLFHKLCQNWQQRIPYDRFTPFLNRENGGTTAELQSLLEKLRKNGVGLLRTRIENSQRVRDAIVLCTPNAPHFYRELIDEYFNDMLESIVNPLPLLSIISEDYGDIPPAVLEIVPTENLARYFGTESEDHRPLAIQTLNQDMLLISRENLRVFVNVTILKMRYYLSNTNLLGLVAKLLDTSLLNLKQQSAGKEPMFWLGLTRKVIEKRKEIEALRNVSVDRNFYHAAWLLKAFIESQLAEAESKKQAEESRQLDLQAIALSIKEAPEGWVEQTQLSRMIESQQEKYGDSFDQFREEFYEKFVHARGKNSLPKIVLLGKRYIHRDNVFPLFLEHFKATEADLKLTFAARMEAQLRGSSKDTTFYSVENFNDAIAAEVRERSEYLSALIDKPSILAEAMILHIKQKKLARNVDELKQRLAFYFDPETMKPLPLYEWFSLRRTELFERAFEKLPILRRIWIRLTGKYESIRSQYVGQEASSRSSERAAHYGSGSASSTSEGQNPRGGRRERSGQGERDARRPAHGQPSSRRGSSGASSGRSSSSRAKPTEAIKKSYSKKQVDSAWEQFGSTIKKKD